MPSGQLQARGNTTARGDGFALFSGRFKIVRLEQGQVKEVYFVGIIYLASRIGSHQALGEECDEKDHLEGWLAGNGRNKLEKYSLRVALVAKGALPSSVLPDASINRISEVLAKRG